MQRVFDKIQKIFICDDGSKVIGQRPNAPLIIWLILLAVHQFSDGSIALYSNLLANGAGLYWGALELLSGVNIFRRIVGGVVCIVLFLQIFKLLFT